MGDHHRRDLLLLDDLHRDVHHLLRRRGIQRGGMLIQQEHLRLGDGSHQQRQRLTLSAGEEADLHLHPVLQAHLEGGELLAIIGEVLLLHRQGQGEALGLVAGQGEVLLDGQIRRGAFHRVLEKGAHQAGALVFRQMLQVIAVQDDFALVHVEGAGNRAKQRGFARAVGTQDGDEIIILQRQGHIAQGGMLIHRALGEGFGHMAEFKHALRLPSGDDGPSFRGSSAVPGRRPRSPRTPASDSTPGRRSGSSPGGSGTGTAPSPG